MIGNSTMADKPFGNGNPEKGWGQILPLYFKENVKIENYAINGRSTKSFIEEGTWAKVLDSITPGDYLIIEFGHNDSKSSDPKRFAAPKTDYRKNLIRFIEEARLKGGIPVLATPINRRKFDTTGIFIDQHGDYPRVVRELSSEYQVLLLDLHKRSEELLNKYGAEDSKKLYLWINANEYESLPNGKTDNTHFSPTGAFRICDLAAGEIRKNIPDLAKWLRD